MTQDIGNMSKGELVCTLMNMWRSTSETYRSLPERYKELLEEKRKLKIEPLGIVARHVLEEYPKISFFEIVEEEKAQERAEQMSPVGLRIAIRTISDTLECDPSYRSLNSFVIDAEYRIFAKRSGRRNPFGVLAQSRMPKVGSCRSGLIFFG